MKFQSEQELNETAHAITQEFLRRNSPPPLSKGATYALDVKTRVNAFVAQYLEVYEQVLARLHEQEG